MYINSRSHYVPATRISNDYFEKVNGLTSDWILRRTGIKSRSKAASDENSDSMAIEAIDATLKGLPYDIKDVDLIVAACYAVYDTVATPAHVAQQHYKIAYAKALYVSAACSSFINGLEVIEGYFASGKAKRALLICTSTTRITATIRIPSRGISGVMPPWHISSAKIVSRNPISRSSMFSQRVSAMLANNPRV